MASVTLNNLTKTFRSRKSNVDALTGVSLCVADGECVVVVGPSGCGKTTLLRLIAGLDDLTSGSIQIGDRDVGGVEPKDRDVAMVFQNYALYPHMTVRKNMAFGLKMRRMPKAQIADQVAETAELLGIARLLDRKPGSLSGGEQQRVALGRAIVRRPAVFLFDEPLSNLDASLRSRMRVEIKELHRKLGATAIYVTHDQEEAMTLGDRIVVLRDGAIQQCGTPLEVYREPANRFVAGFVGAPSMNFLTGELMESGGDMSFECALGRMALRSGNTSHANGEVVLGIRPEHLRFGPRTDTGHDRSSWQPISTMTVRMVEPLGASVDVHLEGSDGHRLVARVSAETTVSIAKQVEVYADATKTHLFANDNDGRRLN